jgi:dienelactone hydrolase
MTTLRPITIHHAGTALTGEAAVPDASGRCPAILVMSNAHGLGRQARERARLLAEQGYVALATDMYAVVLSFASRPKSPLPLPHCRLRRKRSARASLPGMRRSNTCRRRIPDA